MQIGDDLIVNGKGITCIATGKKSGMIEDAEGIEWRALNQYQQIQYHFKEVNPQLYGVERLD